jgi:penicillin-insensitive murein endopeptidase
MNRRRRAGSPAFSALLALFVAISLLLLVRTGRARDRAEPRLPPKYSKSPFAMMSLSVGLPNAGWQLRAKKLKSSSELWIQNKSVPYSYGHPALVLMLYRTAKQIARQSAGSVLLVGDLSRESGGPLAGHRSHQSGRDADVGFFVIDRAGKPINSRRLMRFDRNGLARDGSGLRFDDYRNWLLVQLWLKDDRANLEHVFVATHLRARLLEFARARPAFRRHALAASGFLRQPTNGLPHDDHFHVRIACPEAQRDLCAAHVQGR